MSACVSAILGYFGPSGTNLFWTRESEEEESEKTGPMRLSLFFFFAVR